MPSLHYYIGMAGVDEGESLRTRQLGKLFAYFNIPVVIWLALQWHLVLLDSLTHIEIYIANLSVWFFFFTQFMLLLITVKNKALYIKRNWLFMFIIVLGLPFVFDYQPFVDYLRHYRLILVVLLLLPWIDACRYSLSDNRLGTTLVTALIIIILSGILIAGIDPNIHTFLDGIWWAWVTVSTVGYGDVVPVSGIGRVFAAFLILMGLALFSVLTANFSAFFLQKEVKKVKRENLYIRKILEDLQKVKEEEDDILTVLKDIRTRLARLEKRVKSLAEPKEDKE